jgi:hypothetical protein
MKNKNKNALDSYNFVKIFTFVFIFTLVLSCSLIPNVSLAATTDATLFFNPASQSVTLGGANFNLVARVNPGSNTVQGINAVQLDITFDPAVMHIVSITASGTFTVLGNPDITAANASGSLAVPFFMIASQITTTSDVATIIFHAQGAGTNSAVAFAGTANAAVDDGAGTPVVGTRTGATVTVIDLSDIDPPAFTINDGTAVSVVKNDTINVTVTDVTGVASRFYGFSADSTCNVSDTITTAFSSATNFTIAGDHSDYLCLKATDSSSNSNTGYQLVGQLHVDNTPPIVTQVSAVAAITNKNTPSYIFNSPESGAITYSGGCSSATQTVVSGNNTIVFNTLAREASYDCTIRVTDLAGNQGTVFNIGSFVVTYRGDLNNSRGVDISDLSMLAADYGRTGWSGHATDVNGDGNINLSDLSILSADYGKTF